MVAPPAPPYLGPAANYRKGGNKPIKRITMHSLVSGTGPGTARFFARYFRTTARNASAHYIVDPEETVQVVWDSDTAYHAPPNEHSIGVELADHPGESESNPAPVSRWFSGDRKKTLANAARLVAQLCLAYDVPIRHVGPVRLRLGRKGVSAHVDVSYAWRQTSHWDMGKFPWRKFIRMVKAEADALRVDGVSPTQHTRPQEGEMSFYDEPINAHGWNTGRNESENLTPRQLDTAKAIEIQRGRRHARRYLREAQDYNRKKH